MEVCAGPSVRKICLPHVAWLDFHSKTTWGEGKSVSSSASTPIMLGDFHRASSAEWKWHGSDFRTQSHTTLGASWSESSGALNSPRMNPSKRGNSWNNHCLGDSSVLWNGNYFKAHSVLPSLLWILDTRAVLFSLNCTQCFSVPCLFMSVMCKSPNVPAFEFPANSSSASRKTCISLPQCCSAPKGQAEWGDCSACRDWRAGCSCPPLSKKMSDWPCLHW